VRRGAGRTGGVPPQPTIAAMVRPVRSSMMLLGVLAAEPSWVVARPDGVYPAERGRPAGIQRSAIVATAGNTRTPATRRSPVGVQHAVSTHPGSSSGVRRVWTAGVHRSSVQLSGVQPSGGRARPGSPAAELSWLVGRPHGGGPAERPAGIQRSGVVAVVGTARTPAMASVAGPRPPCGVHAAVASSGSGGLAVQCRAVWCPVPPVSSPSGVRPSGVRPAAVRLRPSGRVHLIPPQAAAVGPGRGGGQPAPPERVESRWPATPWSGSGRRPSRPGRGRCCRGRGGQWGRWRTRARWGDGGRPRLTGCATRQARPACRAPVAGGCAVGRGAGCSARLLQWPRGCLPRWVATTVGGGHWACRPGGRARKGRWACRWGWACGPSAAQAGSGRSRLATDNAVTCGNGWWACQDLNLGPHPDPKILDGQARGSVRAEPGIPIGVALVVR
jgi:hypothetical protein